MYRILIFIVLLLVSINVVSAKNLFVSNDSRLQLGAAQTYYEQSKYTEGLEVIARFLKQRRLSKYEKALAFQMQAYLYAGNDNLAQAVVAFRNSLELEQLDESLSLNLRFNLAQLLVAMAQYQQAIVQFEIWIQKTKSINTQQRLLLATTYYFAKEFTNAEKHTDLILFDVVSPQRSTYELALAIYLENKHYKKAIKVLLNALSHFTQDKNFWRQLANLYRLGNHQVMAVASLQTAYDIALLDGSEIVNLSKMLFYLDTPFSAAQLMQKAMSQQYLDVNAENMQLLAECLLAAREYQSAEESFAEAGRLANDGDLYLRQAEILIDREQWSKSIDALKNAFVTEKLSDEGRAYLLLGIANYEAKKLVAAREAFTLAGKSKKQEKNSKQWLLLIDSKI